jgi:uncharacterized protein (DUF1015 family)
VVTDVTSDGQRHQLSRVHDAEAVAAFAAVLAGSDVYIADGHHRYETALAYRDEVKVRATSWTGDEPENFVLMALTRYDDPGLLVLPTHRVVRRREVPQDVIARLSSRFEIEALADAGEEAVLRRLEDAGAAGGAFVVAGLAGGPHLLRVRERGAIEALMPSEESQAWKQLDVNVLQFGILQDVLGIDDDALKTGSAISYTQDAGEALGAVARGDAAIAFLLNATPVEEVLAVADAGGRMPQKSTYFQPKLPTGLVLRPLGD